MLEEILSSTEPPGQYSSLWDGFLYSGFSAIRMAIVILNPKPGKDVPGFHLYGQLGGLATLTAGLVCLMND
jgi:hypothetical protein